MAGSTAAGKAKRLPVLIVAGPTCSGKSALALWIAQQVGGVVINADSMQVYRELRVVTARPPPAEEALVPHVLYGVRPASEPGSAAWWRGAALAEIAAAEAAGRLPILCGGTGLYFNALLHGLSDIPDPGPAARAEARALLEALGAPGLHARLTEVDPVTAAILRPSDAQRLARAWEVWRGTGRGLASWRLAPVASPEPVDDRHYVAIRLDPPRPELRAAIAHRFAAMLDAGALDEVRSLLALDLDPSLPAMRAHGVPELAAFLHGDIPLAEAARRAALATGQYTKRQATWFRHHPLADQRDTHTIYARFISVEQFSEQEMSELQNFICMRLDGHGMDGLIPAQP